MGSRHSLDIDEALEWLFLTVIYLCVRHPEDLIAMQYTGIHYRDLDDVRR